MLIYVCTPYRGYIEESVEYTRQACRYVFDGGHIPIAPHLLFSRFLDYSNHYERDIGLKLSKKLLAKSDGVWVFGGEITSDMYKEIKIAKNIELPIHFANFGLTACNNFITRRG